jgi:hypothetical protein
MKNRQLAKLLRNVADNIESVSDTSKAGRKKVLEQFERIPLPIEFHHRFLESFKRGLFCESKGAQTGKNS